MRNVFASLVAVGLGIPIACSSSDGHGPTYNEGSGGSTGGGGSRAGGGGVSGSRAGSASASDASTIPTPIEAGAEASAVEARDVVQQPSSACEDASACGLRLTAEAAAIPADGKATDLIGIAVAPAAPGETIELTIVGRGSWQSNGQKQTVVSLDASGRASALFLSDADGGTAIVTAKRTAQPDTASVTIEMPVLGDIQIIQSYAIMGVKSSGFQESNIVTFKAVTVRQAPYPRGLRVELRHKPIGRSTLGALPSCSLPDCEVTDTAVTDDKGEVNVSLVSGTVAGTAIVTIAATAGGQTKVVTTSAAIVGAKASGDNIALDCTPRNVPAAVDTDCRNSRVDSPVQCTATLSDRFGNVVGVKTPVTYLSEAGNLVLPQTTLAYPDPQIGHATGTITTIGGALPVDVPPVPGERSYLFTDVCNHTEHNPRDGIVTVIAVMKGEEGFLDANRDGEFNTGEPFIDIAEPFVDADDNNVQNGAETFLDLNNNQMWDGPNGVWDSSATLWTQTRILYSGSAARVTRGGVEDLSRLLLEPRQVPSSAGPGLTSVSMRPTEVLDIGFFVSDANMNVLAPMAEYTAASSTPVVTVTKAAMMAPRRSEGFFFKQELCDAAAPGVCSSKLAPSATTKRWILKGVPTEFEYGVAGSIHIVAGTPGSFNLLTSASIERTTLLMEVPGTVIAPPPVP